MDMDEELRKNRQALMGIILLFLAIFLVSLWSDLLFNSPFNTILDLALGDNYQREHNFEITSWSPNSRYLIIMDETLIKAKKLNGWVDQFYEIKYYVFDVQSHKMWQLNLDHNYPTSGVYTPYTYLGAVRWSPNSHQIIFRDQNSLFLLDMETSTQSPELLLSSYLGRLDPLWSPGGDEIGYTVITNPGSGASKFQTLNVETREVRDEKPEWWTDQIEPFSAVSPNSRYIVTAESHKLSVYDKELDTDILNLSESETYQYPIVHVNFNQTLLIIGMFSLAIFILIYKAVKFDYFPFRFKGVIVWVVFLVGLIYICGCLNWALMAVD